MTEIRIRKYTHKITSPERTPLKPQCLLHQLKRNIYSRYNCFDNFSYLQQLNNMAKRKINTITIMIKDFKTFNDNEEILQQYLPIQSFPSQMIQVINYYRYYEQTPRIFIKGVEPIVIKNVEDQRLRKYGGLKRLLKGQEQKNQECQVFFELMPLLNSDIKKSIEKQQETLIDVKNDLSILMSQKSWLKKMSSINLSIRTLSNIDENKWKQKIDAQLQLKVHHSKKPKRISNSTNIKIYPSNKSGKKQFIRRSTIKKKPINKNQNTQNKLFSEKDGNTLQKLQHNYDNKDLQFSELNTKNIRIRSQSKSTIPKTFKTLKHSRMHTQPFGSQQSGNNFMISQFGMYKTSQIPKLKRKTKKLISRTRMSGTSTIRA